MKLRTSREEKINLVIVVFVFGPCVVEQLVAGSYQHLCDNVLIDITQIGAEFVVQQFLVDDVLSMVLVPESKRCEQTGVCTVYLELCQKLRKYRNVFVQKLRKYRNVYPTRRKTLCRMEVEQCFFVIFRLFVADFTICFVKNRLAGICLKRRLFARR